MIDTPTPTEPVCGTQNIISRSSHPAMYSGCCGPGTLVATTLALRLNSSSASACNCGGAIPSAARRSEEHTSELQSLMRISYAVFCLKKKKSASEVTILQYTQLLSDIHH